MKTETLVVGGGCFWCVEAMFRDLIGVEGVESGYAGGQVPNPTYKDVCGGQTGHAEVILIRFDSDAISRADLLRVFFVAHDPTTLNRQGGDVGTQYRSVIFYADEGEKALAEEILRETEAQGLWLDPIVTSLEPLKNYSKAEEYHQDYLTKYEQASLIDRLNFNSGYCQAVVQPKVAKFRKAFREKLKTAARS